MISTLPPPTINRSREAKFLKVGFVKEIGRRREGRLLSATITFRLCQVAVTASNLLQWNGLWQRVSPETDCDRKSSMAARHTLHVALTEPLVNYVGKQVAS